MLSSTALISSKGLLPKVLRLQHFGFGPLHQFADSGDIGAAQTVGRPHGQLQLIDPLEEVIVDVGAAAAFPPLSRRCVHQS